MKWRMIQPGSSNYRLAVTGQLGLVIFARSGQSRITVELTKPRARALILGLARVGGKDSLELTVVTIHRRPNTHAETMIYGLVRDRGRAMIKGLIRIEEPAQRVTDFLTERVLLLSSRARATVDPELEIKADEVRASHAAAVSPIGQEELFYLMNRGLPRSKAEAIITAGFLRPVIDRIGDDKIKRQICSELKL